MRRFNTIFVVTLFVGMPFAALAQESAPTPVATSVSETPPASPATVTALPADAPLKEAQVSSTASPIVGTAKSVEAKPQEKGPAKDPSLASYWRAAAGASTDFNVQTGVAAFSPTVSVAITGQKLPSKDTTNLAASYNAQLLLDLYKASNLPTSDDVKGAPQGVDLHLEGAIGAGPGVGVDRACGGAMLALAGVHVRGQTPMSSLGDSSFVGTNARVNADVGSQINLSCTFDGTTFNVGPKVIGTGGASFGRQGQGAIGVADPSMMVGGNLTIIRDKDFMFILEGMKKVHDFGAFSSPGDDSRAKVVVGKKIKSFFGIEGSMIADNFTEFSGNLKATFVW